MVRVRKACLFIFTIVVVVVVIVVVTSSAVRPGVERQGGSMANNYTFLNNLFFFRNALLVLWRGNMGSFPISKTRQGLDNEMSTDLTSSDRIIELLTELNVYNLCNNSSFASGQLFLE